jgi:CheY-like chemotaxis protein
MGALSGRSILVVEDEATIALDLSHMLQDAGAVVVGPVSSVADALRKISETPLDLAVVDIGLGDDRSDQVAVALEQKSVPLVFLTGYTNRRLPRGFETKSLIQKPYSQGELMALIAQIFG